MAFLVMRLIVNISDPFLTIANDKWWFKMESNLMNHYLKKYIHLDNTKVESIGTGKMETIINQWIDKRLELNMSLSVNVIVDFLSIIYALWVIFFSVPLVYFSMVLWLLIASFFLIQYGYKRTESIRENAGETRQEIGRKRVQIIMSKFEIIQNKKIEYETKKLHNLYEKVLGFWTRSNFIAEWWTALWSFLLYATNWIIYLVIGIGVIYHKYTLSEFVLMVGLMGVILTYFWSIRRYIRQYNKNIIPIKQLWKTFDTTPYIHQNDDDPEYSYKKGSISLQNISFAYNKTLIFSNFSFTLTGGKKTAFVGPSGGWKTTLIKLLVGYISPDTGKILIDDQDMSTVKIQSYYSHIGYLTQDPSVFDWTIRENLIYGVKDNEAIDEKDIKHVISLAKCDFIRDFERGRDTEIGERGIRLSGGQKQRLAIAKIMLKNPQIIFLDEPTSAMDSFNEEEVTQALHNLFQDRTVIVVAHRLQTVKQADKIYYLEAGEHWAQIVEEWTHAELVKHGWKYKKMLDLQSWF